MPPDRYLSSSVDLADDDLTDDDLTDDAPFTDDELTELALAADIDAPLADDAVPFDARDPAFGDLLPNWYMPAPSAGVRQRRHSVTAAVIVLSLLGVNAVGLCVTNGFLEIAW